MWVVHLTPPPFTPPAQYYFPPYTPKPNFKIIPFNDFLLLNGEGWFFPKILDNLEVVTISDYIEVQTQTRSKQTRNDQTRVPQTRWNAFTFLNHTFLGLTRFNFKRCGGHMNHNGTNRFTPFFSNNNYLIYFWDFSLKFAQSPPNVRNIRYLLLKIRSFLQKNERNRFSTGETVQHGEPVRAVVVHMLARTKQ